MKDGGLLARLFGRIAQRDLDTTIAASLGADTIDRMLAALVENGFSPKTDTWVADGEMKPLSPDEMRVGIGDRLLFEMTSQHAVSPDETAALLAEHLPTIVRQLRSSGVVKSPVSGPDPH